MLTRLTYRLGQLVGIILAAAVAVLALAVLVTFGRAVWWLITDHPVIAAGAALAGALWAVLTNYNHGRAQL